MNIRGLPSHVGLLDILIFVDFPICLVANSLPEKPKKRYPMMPVEKEKATDFRQWLLQMRANRV
jgi:hypothetical protein